MSLTIALHTKIKSLIVTVIFITSFSALVPRLIHPASGSTTPTITSHFVQEHLGESDLSANPTDPTNIILVSEGFPTGSSLFYSGDSGVTWANASSPPLCGLCSEGDATISFDANGNAFYIPLLVVNATIHQVELLAQKSTDKGHSYFDLPSPVWTNTTSFRLPDGTTQLPCGGLNEQPKLAIDTSSSSPFRNYIYVIAPIQFTISGSCQQRPAFSRSINGGATWMDQQVLSTDPLSSYTDGLGLAVNGTIFRASSGCNGFCIAVQRSTDGGHTFTRTTTPLPASIQVSNAHLTVAASKTDPLKASLSFLGLSSVWPNIHVYVMSTVNAGATWGSPVRVDDVLPNDIVWHDKESLSASSTGRLDMEWFDFRNSPIPTQTNATKPDVYYSFSNDGGNTWAPNIRLTPHPSSWCFGGTASFGCSPPNGNDYQTIISSGTTAYASYSVDLNNDSATDPNPLEGYVTAIMFQPFTISENPSSEMFPVVSEQNTSITVSSVAPFSGNVSLAATPSSVALKCWFTTQSNMASVFVSSGSKANQTLTCASSTGTGTEGTYTVTIVGTSGSVTSSVILSITLQGFNISGPSTVSFPAGSSSYANVSLTSLLGFSGTVNLSVFPDPSAVTVSCPSSVNLTPGSIVGSSCSFSSSIPGQYSVGINAYYVCSSNCNPSNLEESRSVTITVNVEDFTIAAGAVSPASILAGSSGTSTITLTALNGLTGTVSLSVSGSNPAGLTCTLPSSVTFGSSPQTATLSCSANVASDYAVTVAGTDGKLSHTTTTILFHIVDFKVSSNPNSLSIRHGNSGSSTISLTSLNGFSGTVTLTATVTPNVSNKPTPMFSPSSVTLTPNGSGSSTLTISTSHNTARQAYTVTVTATSGSLVHTVTITVTVT